MKTKIIALLILAFLACSLFSQGIVDKGIKAGINLANLTGDDVSDDAGMKFGIAAGGYLVYEINPMFALQPELLFTMKGTFVDGEGYEQTTNLNYIEIPVLAKLNIPMDGMMKPAVFLGPAFGINMSATYDYESDYGDDDGDIDDIKSTDFGLVLGAGASFGKISVDARYNMGLTNIYDLDGDPEAKNSVISLLFGYGI